VDTRLAEYVRGQWPTLVRYTTLLCGDASEAEEIVQSTLTRVVMRWRFVDDKANPDGYVRRALIRACIDSGKRRRRESAVGILPDVGVPDRAGQLADSDQVRRALATLPPRQRAVLVLRYLDDATEAKTAELLGCSVGTVKSQTSKGLAKLRVALALPDEGRDNRLDAMPAGPHGEASPSTEVRDR
jgi:RNA polymerase sigma-70 factor (sigma-E family)